MNADVYSYTDSAAPNAWAVLSVLLIVAACVVADAAIGLRGVDVGTDTHVYAGFFLAMRDGFADTRFEPGFVLLTRLLSATGMSVLAYQAVLFAISLVLVTLTARRYFHYLGATHGFLTFLGAVLMFLFLSPMFVNGSINAVRQGMAAPLVFAALLSFHHRQWRRFVVYGLIASSLHYSSLLYLFFAPVLLIRPRLQRIVAGVAFLIYCSGLSMVLVRTLVPGVYTAVMTYSPGATYRAGVRLDFALFSMAWYVLPFVASRLIRPAFSARINQGMAVYLVMLLPFFAVGWGNYSNRYLLGPWVAISFIVAAMFCFARTPVLRHPLLLRAGLLFSCGVFTFFVARQVII